MLRKLLSPSFIQIFLLTWSKGNRYHMLDAAFRPPLLQYAQTMISVCTWDDVCMTSKGILIRSLNESWCLTSCTRIISWLTEYSVFKSLLWHPERKWKKIFYTVKIHCICRAFIERYIKIRPELRFSLVNCLMITLAMMVSSIYWASLLVISHVVNLYLNKLDIVSKQGWNKGIHR